MPESASPPPPLAPTEPVEPVATTPPPPLAPTDPTGPVESVATTDTLELGGGQLLHVESRGTETELTVVSGATTLVRVRIDGDTAELLLDHHCRVRSSGDLTLEGERLTLRAREALSIESDGDTRLCSKGDFSSSARVQSIRSTLGNVDIKANDDVRLRAERILLNT